MAQYTREPRDYELMVILLPELADEDLTGAIDRVSTYVTDIGGEIREILKDSPWGRRRLAYTIRFNSQDYRDGYYIIWHFQAGPGTLSDLERELKLDTRVMRYLLVLEDPKWNSPQEREAAREAANAPAVEEAAPEAAAETVADAPAEEAAAEAPVAEAAAEVPAVEAAVEEVAAEVAAEVVTEAPAEVAEAPAEAVVADEAPAAEETSDKA